MRYYKRADDSLMMCASGMPDLNEISKEEYETEKSNIGKRIKAAQSIAERTRLLTAEEVTRLLIKQQINTLEVNDNTALRMVEFYPEWNGLIGQTVDKAGFRFTYGGNLYKTIPANHTFQADWVPGTSTESLYTRIDETNDGTQYDPIPYDGNMELTEGMYYTQDGVVYLCTRSTGQPVYNALSDLVGLYVEIV